MLFTNILSKVVVPTIVCAALPVKETLPPPDVNVPLFVQFPNTVKSEVLLMFKEAAPLIVMLLQTAPIVEISGMFETEEVITTLVVEVGIPPHQLFASNQSLFTPNQVPGLTTDKVIEEEEAVQGELVIVQDNV